MLSLCFSLKNVKLRACRTTGVSPPLACFLVGLLFSGVCVVSWTLEGLKLGDLQMCCVAGCMVCRCQV